ncbi:biosynthetic peptidoglycan transglycosylase [Salinimicrobium sediminilitoris]|uniref:biosynthetic peptidoglycan transglycosylase n=1 Tax=Salinimicrobium sediminilitoris TaxID=2876715 RepID=UPI001E58F23D|nr:biosynthetic peptidoglycan transglycosylase [Salinimicrobium sediminilitoris]MCC8360611.1 transglycosylase domain-containing protein [Salinimicrobium sediminilitoris]
MDNEAEQYYPTYNFKPENRDVVLLEFEEAQKIANGQTKVYGQVTNILLAVVTVLIPLFFNLDKKNNHAFNLIKENALFFSTIIFLFGALLLRYFVDLQKQITINGRKVVTLRAMLGLDYGRIHLTLPNWRVEGATNPFAIKYFNGWLMFQSMPFWVLAIGVNAIWWLTTNDRTAFPVTINDTIIFRVPWLTGNFIISIAYLLVFRRNLNDTHETSFLNIGRFLANLIRYHLIDNFEYVIYRAKLEVVEMSRLNVNFENLKSILIDIEDKSFYSNKGVSIKAIIRGSLSQIKPFRKAFRLIESGGSTITMQLARTLFIPSNQNKYLRKFFEIWIALWLQRKFTKKEILDLYVVSVRYDYGVMGLSKAIKHFYGDIKRKKLTPEESFVLVERLSNVTGTHRQDRIDFLISKSTVKLDSGKINIIYKTLKEQGKIKK